jgi:hypothetical protein
VRSPGLKVSVTWILTTKLRPKSSSESLASFSSSESLSKTFKGNRRLDLCRGTLGVGDNCFVATASLFVVKGLGRIKFLRLNCFVGRGRQL